MTAVVEAPVGVAPSRSLRLSSQTQVVCAWITFVCILLSGLAFVVADFIPPPRADASAQDIANFYADHTGRIRAGLLLMFISWAGWGTLVACIATQMQRIEGGRPILTNILMLSGKTEKSERMEEEGLVYSDFRSDRFFRQFTLPSLVDAEKATAELKDGILHIDLPKTTAEPVTKIAIAATGK